MLVISQFSFDATTADGEPPAAEKFFEYFPPDGEEYRIYSAFRLADFLS
jgi:hypothetical protein